jgi:hypothetical protein
MRQTRQPRTAGEWHGNPVRLDFARTQNQYMRGRRTTLFRHRDELFHDSAEMDRLAYITHLSDPRSLQPLLNKSRLTASARSVSDRVDAFATH